MRSSLRSGGGGVYTDNDAAARTMTEVFERCQNLIGLANEHEFAPDSPWRLLCLDSGFRDVSAVGWIRVPDRDVDATWRFTKSGRYVTRRHVARRRTSAGVGGRTVTATVVAHMASMPLSGLGVVDSLPHRGGDPVARMN